MGMSNNTTKTIAIARLNQLARIVRRGGKLTEAQEAEYASLDAAVNDFPRGPAPKSIYDLAIAKVMWEGDARNTEVR
jgi:hypothetical protein